MSAERDRVAGFGQLDEGLLQASDWYLWGPYLSERQWATVREDYSQDGAAWESFPHDHARSRAYRWGEDGMAGFSEYELVDTGIFDEGRYWVVEVEYAKAGPRDLLRAVRATNMGPHEATLHVLPTLWYRNTWSWGDGTYKPELVARASTIEICHPLFGRMQLFFGPGPSGAPPALLSSARTKPTSPACSGPRR
jgi:hypothetical protein